jgi:hypothetical protein
MSKMKDFLLWLEENNYATYKEDWEEFRFVDTKGQHIPNPVHSTELVALYRNDSKWHKKEKPDDAK